MILFQELEWIGKKMVTAYFMVLSWYSPIQTMGNHEKHKSE